MKQKSAIHFLFPPVLVILILMAGSISSHSQPNTWQQKASLNSSSRFLATGFGIGQKGYVGLGFNYSTDFKDFWEYDPATDTWSQQILEVATVMQQLHS